MWPAISSSTSTSPSTTGFALKKGEARVINVPWVWSVEIWGRTLCAGDSTGEFSCATGDCGTGRIECLDKYPNYDGVENSPRNQVFFDSDNVGSDIIDLYYVGALDGYNLPMQVVPVPQQGTLTTGRCDVASCDIVDLNKLPCPYELMVVDEEERPIACTSPCPFSDCSTSSSYWKNFKRACPTTRVDHGEGFFHNACPNSTDYVITFCPSVTPILTR